MAPSVGTRPALIAGGLLLTRAVGLGLEPAELCRLRRSLGRAPLSRLMGMHSRQWRVEGGELRAAAGGMAAGADVGYLVPAASDVMHALRVARAELGRRGLCADPRRPLVLSGPSGAASLVGACAVAADATLDAQMEARRRDAARCTGANPPRVLCADGTCRPTFVHCYRAAFNASLADELLAHALPDECDRRGGDRAARRRRLDEALPRAAELLEALASFQRASREIFPSLCSDGPQC